MWLTYQIIATRALSALNFKRSFSKIKDPMCSLKEVLSPKIEELLNSTFVTINFMQLPVTQKFKVLQNVFESLENEKRQGFYCNE